MELLDKICLFLGEDVGGEGMAAVGTVTSDIAQNPNKFIVGATPPSHVKKKKKKKKKPTMEL